MLTRMQEKKGFTLVELMIVVAIVGILTAVAIPLFQKYVQKSRVSVLVMPGVHSIMTNIATYCSVRSILPDGNSSGQEVSDFIRDADTTYFTPTLTTGGVLKIQLKDTEDKFKALIDQGVSSMSFRPEMNFGRISKWEIGGSLAKELGLDNE